MGEYVYSHYPLARYRDGAYMSVANEQEQAAAESGGWTDWHTDQARMQIPAGDGDTEMTKEEPGASSDSQAPEEVAFEVSARKKPGRKPRQSKPA